MQKEYQKQGKPCNFGLCVKNHCNDWITRLIYSRHSSISTESTTGAPHRGWITEACVLKIAFHKNSLWLLLWENRSLSNLKEFNQNSFWSLSDFIMYKLCGTCTQFTYMQDLVSPVYLGLKIKLLLIVLLTVARLCNSLIYEDLASP